MEVQSIVGAGDASDASGAVVPVLEAASTARNEAASRIPAKITNWTVNTKAQVAVLEVWSQLKCHTAPYGKGGKRMKAAAVSLAQLHGYTANPRTMLAWVKELMKEYASGENRLDNETEEEYERDPDDKRIRQLLTDMFEERQDFESNKVEKSNNKMRDPILAQQGRQLRENTSRTIPSGQDRNIVGGPAAELGENQNGNSNVRGASSLFSPRSSDQSIEADADSRPFTRRRLNPSANDVVLQLLAGSRDTEQARLEFEKEQWRKNHELRLLEVKQQAEAAQLLLKQTAEEMQLRNMQAKRAMEQWKQEMQLRMKEMEDRQKAEQAQLKQSNDQFKMMHELKMAKLNLMLSKKQ